MIYTHGQTAPDCPLSRSMATIAFMGQLANGRLLGVGIQMRPGGFRWNPKDTFGSVFVCTHRVGPFIITFTRDQLLMQFGEGLGNEFQADRTENDMLVLSDGGRFRIVTVYCDFAARKTTEVHVSPRLASSTASE